jgi:hypothetical protein
MRQRFLRQEKEAIRATYKQNVVYRAVRDTCTQFERLTPNLKLAHEEVFVECYTILDRMKEEPSDATRYVGTLWDILYNDIRDLDNRVPEDELQTAVTVILFMTDLLITESTSSFYRDLGNGIMEQIANNNSDADRVLNLINPVIFRLSDNDYTELRDTVDNYLESDQWISDDVEDMLKQLPSSDIFNSIESEGEDIDQLSNRQLIILFESLLNIPLSSSDTNISAFANLIGRVAGKSAGSIRKLIRNFSYNDKQTKRDAEGVANLVRPLKPDLAQNIQNNIEE